MYDMYSWDQAASTADDHAETAAAAKNGRAAHAAAPALADAVQVALDRRDNGGEAGRRGLGC